MTTGNKTVDLRFWSTAPVCRLGLYSNRVWSGADYPAVRPYTKNIYDKRTGRFLWTRTYWPRAPKRARIVEHAYTTNGSEVSSYTRLQTKYTATSGNPWVPSSTSMSLGVRCEPDTVWTSNDEIALLGKLREAVAGSNFNLGTTLGEGREALTMIGDNAKAIAKSLLLAKRGKFKEAVKSLNQYKARYNERWQRNMVMKYDNHGRPLGLGYQGQVRMRVPVGTSYAGTAANAHLELTYGILPLLQDVKQGAEFLAHNLNTPASFSVKVRRQLGGKAGRPYADTSNAEFYYDGTSFMSKQIKAILSEDVTRIAQLSGVMDPASVAWELLPWSFVADWFIPIGDYLAARGLASALRSQKFVISFLRRAYHKGPAKPKQYYAIHPSDNAQSYRRYSWRLDRTIVTNLEVPLPSVKPLSSIASWKHAANAVALVTSLRT